jgi:arabinose-5-phosphate isomerase
MLNDASRKVVALRGSLGAAKAVPVVEEARDVFREQAAAIAELADRVDERYEKAVEILFSTEGHVVLFGVGKSGIIGRKIASTLASTGTPSMFVHAGEALHGDLGMVTSRDCAVLVSYSGETEEILKLLPHLGRLGIPTIALCGATGSTLARSASVFLDVSVTREACPNNLAPTNSTLVALAMGDALACSLIRKRQFRAADFARVHPGGNLGRRLLGQVKDAMRTADLPIVKPTASVGESLVTITQGRLGLALVMSGDRLVGLVTDGDLRRAMQRHGDLLSLPVSEIMTLNPVTIDENTVLDDAHKRMQQMKLKALVAVGRDGKVTGVIEVFDER